MRHLSTLSILALSTTVNAQSWSYVGGPCALPSGSAELEFRSDGTAIAGSFEPFVLSLREWDGSSWSVLPAPPGLTGTIGGFDLEMHNDVPYIAVSNTGLKVYRLDAGAWTALGSPIAGTWSTNYDFIVDNNGVPTVVHGLERKLHTFDGTAWNHTHTFPQGAFPNTIAYGITGDHTLGCNADNELVYVVSVNDRQLMKAFDGVAETVVGDTILRHQPFSWYTAHIFRNGAGHLFVTMQRFGGTPFIKRYDGTSWSQYGDTTGFVLGSGNALVGFRSNDALVWTTQGHTTKRVYGCAGANAPFVPLDTLDHAGFAQFTDMDVDPTDGSVHATFNCLPTAAVMRFGGSSSIGDLPRNGFEAEVFPNPSGGVLHIRGTEAIAAYRLMDATGRQVRTGRAITGTLDLTDLPAGTYHLHLMDRSGQWLAKPVVRL